MQIRLNGKPQTLTENIATIDDLLREFNYTGQSIAVAVNQEFLARSNYPTTQLKEGHDIEVVSPMAGG